MNEPAETLVSSNPRSSDWAEALLKLTWQCSLDGMRLTDEAGRIVMVNDAFCRLVEQPKAGLEGRMMTAPYVTDLHAGILAKHRRRFQDRTVEPHCEKRVTLASGREVVLELSNSFIEMPGQPPLLLSIFRDITARKEAERAITERDEQLRMTLEAAGMVTWDWNTQSGAVSYSNNLPAIVRGELTARYHTLESLMPEIHPDDRERLSRALESTRVEGCPWECDYRVRMLDGEYRWILGKGNKAITQSGKPVRVLGISQDITERKRAEELLKTQAQMLEHLAEGVHLIDRESMKILFANPATEAMFGYERGELIGRSALDLIGTPASELPALRDSIRTTVAQGRRWIGTSLKRRKDGTRFFSEAQVSGVTLNGRFCYIVHERDASERQQAEIQLRQSLHRYVTLAESSPDAVSVQTADGLHLYVNSNHARWLGRTPEEFAGRNLVEFWSPQHAQRLLTEIREVLREGKPVSFERPSLLRPDHWVEMRMTPMADADGNHSLVLAVVRDITERKRAEVTRETLLSLESKLNATVHPQEAARIIFEASSRLWRWDSATLDLFHPETDRAESVLNFDTLDGQRHEVPSMNMSGLPSARMRRVMADGAELILRAEPDVATSDSIRFGDTSRASASIMCVPVRFRGQALGTMSLQSYSPKAFSEDDLRMFQGLADHCGGALERIQSVEAMRRSQFLLDAQFRNSPDIIFIADRELRFVTINRVLTQPLKPEELVGRDVVSVLPADEQERMRGHLAECFATGEMLEVEHRLHGGHWVRARLVPLRHGDQVTNVMVISTVITERKAAETALREREALQRTILQTTKDAFCMVTRRGKILEANEAFCAMSGYTQAELLSMAITDLEVNWSDPARFSRRVGRIVRAERERFETRHRTKDGRIIDLEISANVLEPDGQRLCAFIRDITDRKRTEDALRKLTTDLQTANVALMSEASQRRKLERQLIKAGDLEKQRIGRDLHDGLCQITMGTALLSETLGAELRQHALARQARQADRVAKLIRSVGEEARRISRGLSPVSLGAEGLATALEELATSTARLLRIPCRFRCQSPILVRDQAVATHLFRIAQEAVNNAARHAGPRIIDIGLARRAGAIVLSVSDNGRGLPKKGTQGRGMGLQVMRHRAELIGGVLEIERNRAGGTTVKCRLPEASVMPPSDAATNLARKARRAAHS